MGTCVPSSSGMTEIAAGSLSSIANYPPALPYRIPLLQPATLVTCSFNASHCMPVIVLYQKIENVFFVFCVFFKMYYLCEKYYKSIIVQYSVANCVSCVNLG